MKTIGEYIKNKREQSQITMRQLASKLNIDVATLSKIENDYRHLPIKYLDSLARIFKDSYETIEKHYLYSNILRHFSDIPNYHSKILSILGEEPTSIEEIIQNGEDNTTEFKSSFRYCLRTKKYEKNIEYACIKNIAAFLNTNGGKLLIGVDDEGSKIGLEETDFITFKGENKIDEFLKYFDCLINKFFGDSYTNFIKIEMIKESKTIAKVEVLRNYQKPTIIKNPTKDNKEEFYIRRNASAIALSMEEFYLYTNEKWNTQGNKL